MTYETAASSLLTLDNAGPIQMGFWVPNRLWATAKYLIPLRDHIAAKKKAGTLTPMTPEMQEFKDWVTSHGIYRMWVMSMIDQANIYVAAAGEQIRKEIKSDGDVVWLEGYDSLFEILNEIITTSPSCFSGSFSSALACSALASTCCNSLAPFADISCKVAIG